MKAAHLKFDNQEQYHIFNNIYSYAESVNYADSAHGFDHVLRVLKNALDIQRQEGGNLFTVIIAVLLHDCVSIPKNHPDSNISSTLSANKAVELLRKYYINGTDLEAIHHAIEAHSYSRGITPNTIEAAIVQDADRLDALGAIGIARMFSVSGSLKRSLYDYPDPLAKHRKLDDKTYTLDHIETKLLQLPELMQTSAGKHMAFERANFINSFKEQLISEIRAS
ncbi:MAG: HD domain-containing protein [Pseudomonadota bacterium]|nr:HD domain-containing protein [Pseudomonadota bacterium]